MEVAQTSRTDSEMTQFMHQSEQATTFCISSVERDDGERPLRNGETLHLARANALGLDDKNAELLRTVDARPKGVTRIGPVRFECVEAQG